MLKRKSKKEKVVKSIDDYKTIKVTRSEYAKKGKKWVLQDKKKFLVSPKQHDNATNKNTLRFFRGLGGYEKNEMSYTKAGYKVVKNTSISPDGKTKIVRNYNFDSDKLRSRARKNLMRSYARHK